MGIILKIIGIIWAVFCAITALGFFTGGDIANGVVLLMLGCIGLIPLFRKKKETKSKINETSYLQSQGFNVSKSVALPGGSFLVDDMSKRIAAVQKGKIRILYYSDIGEYELNEDGNSIAKGKGLATVVGGLALGAVGAIAGSVGKRKQESTCSSLIVRIMVNDLQSPQIVIRYIATDIKKSSPFYKKTFESAKELMAVLSYIENSGDKS